ncbi:MAG: hypothetical protein SWK76_11515 [Actinomycetota bacterium]|nr:hypothetical protein [Actinomycetota bacterium]
MGEQPTVSEELHILREKLRAVSEALAILDLAGGEVTGKSAPQLMYFAAKDLGAKEAAGYDHTDDIERALNWVFPESRRVWNITLWKDQGEDDYWAMEGEEMSIKLLFEECPVREMCTAAGVRLGGVACQAMHGYAAGMLWQIFGRRVDINIEHSGPGSCLLVLKTVME